MRKITEILAIKLKFRDLVAPFTFIVCFFSIISFFGKFIIYLDPLSSFRVHYFFILFVCSIVLIALRKRWFGIIAAVISIANLAFLVPLYIDKEVSVDRGQAFRVMHLNVHIQNQNFKRTLQFISSTDPDIVLLQEVTSEWNSTIKELQKEYPYMQSRIREDCFGIALLSRFPFFDFQFMDFGDIDIPSTVATFSIDRHKVVFVGTHFLPPVFRSFFGERVLHCNELARFVSSFDKNVIVMGDLNMTPWSHLFKDLIQSGLRDARQGHGVNVTWPVQLPFLWIPIDHCLISDGLHVQNLMIGPNVGSDHYPVVVDIRVVE